LQWGKRKIISGVSWGLGEGKTARASIGDKKIRGKKKNKEKKLGLGNQSLMGRKGCHGWR